MYIEQLYTNCLSEAAYYIESDGEAAIIDPLRETEPYLALAEQRKAKIKYVLETHFHADFVSGHIDLARAAGARIVFGPEANTQYPVHHALDGEILKLGKVAFKVLHTPGHTLESTCYLLLDEKQKEKAVFTGDTLFVGDVGRPDLLEGVTQPEELAGMMYDSLNNKIKVLGDAVIVYPAHGPGSACGKNIGKETFSTIGEEKKFNYAMKSVDRNAFIKELTAGITPPPSYFFEDARINKEGYDSIENVMKDNKRPLSLTQFREAVKQGAWILDTRDAEQFEKGFLPGSLNIGLNGQYAVWVGTLIDIHQPLVLVTEVGKAEEAVLRLARVGYENVIGFLKGGINTAGDGTLETIHSIEASQMLSEIEKRIPVLDVRKQGEWGISHLKGAQFLPLSGMPDNLKTLDKTKPYIVYCGGGYRSMIAISLMKRNGFAHVTNVLGGFGAMQDIGLKLESTDNVLSLPH